MAEVGGWQCSGGRATARLRCRVCSAAAISRCRCAANHTHGYKVPRRRKETAWYEQARRSAHLRRGGAVGVRRTREGGRRS